MSKKRIYVAALFALICVVTFASNKLQQKQSNFLSIDITNIQPTEISNPSANDLINGNPEFRSWTMESSDKGISAGVWESTPGKWRFSITHWEYCRIISGISVVTEAAGKSYTVRAGDSFILKPGFSGTWEVIETTRKDFVAY